jgi:hypothetical protein
MTPGVLEALTQPIFRCAEMARVLVPDDLWGVIGPQLPAPPQVGPKGGRPAARTGRL